MLDDWLLGWLTWDRRWALSTDACESALVHASYSHHRAHALPGGSGRLMMLLAYVVVGHSTDERLPSAASKQRRMPPVKPAVDAAGAAAGAGGTATGASEERYDSVCGQTGGSQVFMVYARRKAYPTYVLTYTCG